MPDEIRVNVRTQVNTKTHKKEKRNGRNVLVVSSATLPDDVVMNGIRYPAAEIAKSYKGLERSPAPLGHPTVNGKFVSATDPEGINAFWIGAHNENVRQEGGRVLLDKVIDVEVANRTQGGKDVINAIEAGEPIHTSTGLILHRTPAVNDDGAEFVASNMLFDHDAILMGESGAATPEQGVGMMVNSSGKDIVVVNSYLDDAERQMDWAIDEVVRAQEKVAMHPIRERIKAAILSAFSGEEAKISNTSEEDTMADDAKLTEVANSVGALTAAMKTFQTELPDLFANAVKDAIKPMADNFAAMNKRQEEAEEEELEGYKKKIVKANLLDEASCKGLTLNAAKALAARADPKSAAALNGAGDLDANAKADEFKGMDLNSEIDGKADK